MLYVVAILIGFGVGFLAAYLAGEAKRKRVTDDLQRLNADRERINREKREFDESMRETRDLQKDLETRVATLQRLEDENGILKRDLRNLNIQTQKIAIDRDEQRAKQEELDREINELARKYLKENIKWIGKSLTPNNFAASKKRLITVIESCRKIGFKIPATEENEYIANLQEEFEKAVRAAFEREEQARIKAQIREEKRREKEIERELKRLDDERAAIEAALAQALAEAKDEHSAEIESLRQRLAEAEEKSQRAISQAQLTKSGHVYVISNIGSFGEGVYKVGMTRRLEPMLRVKELGDASVPFPFDVHMMISSDNAPELENALHKELHHSRLNRVNPRKEFFKADLDRIVKVVKAKHGEIEYVADPEALEYRQSLETSDEDQDYIEHVYEEVGYDEDED